jgi:plastocyanin
MAVRLTRGRLAFIGAGAVAAGLLVPGVANGATASAQWGDFDRNSPLAWNTLLPGTVTIEKGDKVSFTVVGFHTVTLPGRGAKLPPLIVPSGQNNPAQNDPGGTPYWWGGVTPLLQLNPAALGPSGGTVFNGSRTVNSGAVQGNPPKFTVTFTKKGTFTVRCLVHPKMTGKIRVVDDSTDTAAKRRARAARERAAQKATALKTVAKAAKATGATVQIGPGNAKVQALAFYPANRKVTPGGTVNFKMVGKNEVHTVTFGPKAYVEGVAKTTFQGQGLELAGEGMYPSDPPAAGVPSLTPTSHGNGFLNSGVLADPGSGIPGPKAFSVTFPVAGSFEYMCLVHPEMRGRITVG